MTRLSYMALPFYVVMYRFGGISELSYKLIKAPFFASTYVESENQVLHSWH